MGYYSQLKKFKGLRGLIEKEPLVAVRSSATAEDLPTASFAGQQATFLNVKGEFAVVDAVKAAWASLFEARAIFYRQQNHFDHFKVGIAVPVQKMIQSETSGIMFTVSPVSNDKETVVIEAVWGLGELIVQGTVTPDHYEINKENLKISLKNHVRQDKMMAGRKIVSVPTKLRNKIKLTDNQIVKLAILGKKLEKHYFHPQDIEFAIEKNEIYIVQTRPITTLNSTSVTLEPVKIELKKMPVILEGSPASPGIKSGPVKILKSAKEIGKIMVGDVLVAPQTNPDFVPAMKKAVAIVTDHGGRTSHAAIVSRELGIPAVVGTENATKKLKNGQVVTVDGSTGKIYRGGLSSQISPIGQINPIGQIGQPLKTATKIYVNLAEPEKALEISKMNVDGIGLLRAEFIMSQMGIHPKKIIADGKQKTYIDNLASNLKTFAESFYPRPVVYRATDFKTNEYRNLKGGDKYEPEEPNPMLGFRGAYRYIVQPDVFKMEIEAIKLVRNKYGFKNLWLMIPFVRTVMELIEVKSLLHTQGLHRSPSFHLWMMVEIPSNVILLDKFIEAGIDGVSIGSNDLTMMLLGTDRDNNTVAKEFDERNPAVLWAL
ncbi:MAG: phosphoenolpyruvate synthase, partial [Patescibacteria group bacterium]